MGEHKQRGQVHQVVLTNSERFALCELMLVSSVKGRQDARRFNRAFDAAELAEYEERVGDGAAPEAGERLFDLTVENVEVILEIHDRTELRGRGARRLGSMVERFEAVKAGTYELPERYRPKLATVPDGG